SVAALASDGAGRVCRHSARADTDGAVLQAGGDAARAGRGCLPRRSYDRLFHDLRARGRLAPAPRPRRSLRLDSYVLGPPRADFSCDLRPLARSAIPLRSASRLVTMPAVVPRSGLHRSEHRLLLTAGDGIVAVVALAVALRIWSITTGFPFSLAFIAGHAAWLIAVPLWLGVTVPTRAWNSAHALPRTISGLLSAAGALAGFYVILYFYAPPSALARLPALYFLWEAVLLTVAWRMIYLFVLGRGGFTRRAVIVGDGQRARAARDLLQREARDTVIVGFVSDNEQGGSIDGQAVRPLSALDGLAEEGIAEVVLAIDRTPSPHLSEKLLRLQENGLDVVPFAAEYEQRLQRVPIVHIDSDWAFQSLPEW